MSSLVFYMKRGATAPRIGGTLRAPTAVAKDLTGATGVLIIQPNGTTGEGVELGAVTITPATRAWYYDWQAGDTDRAAGTYDVEVKVTYADGSIEIFPGASFASLIISNAIILAV